MHKSLLLYLASSIALAGCGGPLGKWELQKDPVAEINAGAGGRHETVAKDGVEYQIERSGAHPAISWAVGPNRLAAMMNNAADTINYGTIDALKGNRYTFIRECTGIAKSGDQFSGFKELPVTFRIFQYSDQNTLYVLRDVDMNGKKFRTFIAVASWQKPTGNYAHWIEQATNELGEIKYCPST